MTKQRTLFMGVLLAGGLLAGCGDRTEPAAPGAAPPVARGDRSQTVPAPLATVGFGSRQLTLWPYTGDDFSGTPVDPINILFPGRTPMQIRAALLALDGNRSPQFPAAPPFTCVWQDAAGGSNQTAYTQAAGWVGSVIQLTCGNFAVRYHLRLFSAGDWTMGGAHFEVQIPGLPNHESLSWERARELVVYDFYRSGLLDKSAPMLDVNVGSATPTYRTINPQVYFPLAQAQPALAAYIGAVVVGPNDVRIPNSGTATALNLASTPAIQAMTAHEDFTIQMGQVSPKPFCQSGPSDYVYVSGPMHVSEQVRVTPSGNYFSTSELTVQLDVTPIDPSTGQPTGPSFKGLITELNGNRLTGNTQLVTLSGVQSMFPAAPFRGTLTTELRVGPGNSSQFSKQLHCDQ